MDVRQLLKQAQELQDKMQRELPDVVVEATVGGGMVRVTVNGNKHVLGVYIDPEVMDPEDPGMIEDLLLAAVNQAMRQLEEALHAKVGDIASALSPL